MLTRWLAVGVAAVAVAVFTPACSTQHLFAPPCAATAGAGRTALQWEQAVNATTIAAVGARMGVPDHGVTIALATALQESKLRNLSSGDRDSVGLFQQRPSQGWGPRASLLDPRFATTAFFEHLLKIDGWQGLPVTEAAQQVQHSAAPSAYAAWEPPARVIAQALTGEVTAGLTCRVGHPGSRPGLGTAVGAALGPGAIGAPVSAARGWLAASWLVARADVYPVAAVSFAGWRWTATSGRWVADPGATGVVTVTGPTP
ncbi:MAG: hypothetical protein NVSMB12_12450 [Acidimicrobiales bacterium]